MMNTQTTLLTTPAKETSKTSPIKKRTKRFKMPPAQARHSLKPGAGIFSVAQTDVNTVQGIKEKRNNNSFREQYLGRVTDLMMNSPHSEKSIKLDPQASLAKCPRPKAPKRIDIEPQYIEATTGSTRKIIQFESYTSLPRIISVNPMLNNFQSYPSGTIDPSELARLPPLVPTFPHAQVQSGMNHVFIGNIPKTLPVPIQRMPLVKQPELGPRYIRSPTGYNPGPTHIRPPFAVGWEPVCPPSPTGAGISVRNDSMKPQRSHLPMVPERAVAPVPIPVVPAYMRMPTRRFVMLDCNNRGYKCPGCNHRYLYRWELKDHLSKNRFHYQLSKDLLYFSFRGHVYPFFDVDE